MQHTPEFRKRLKNRLKGTLPGEDAQYAMAPLKRRTEDVLLRSSGTKPRQSGVMLILYPDRNETHVPMIVRNVYKGVHSGQVGLPGGKLEKHDRDIMHTAIRETEEEISVKITEDQVIGRLSELFVSVSNYIVHPFVAWLDEKPGLIPEESEVQGILEVPLSHLMDSTNVEERAIRTNSGFSIKAPGIPIEDRFLWGATAMMISEFLTVLRDF
jgi:8-oxo-dGTP pyrophosphatase MutT (NUDIX family)